LRENSGFKGGVAEWVLDFEREFGFKGGVAEWVSESEREFGFQRGRCRVVVGI